MPSPEVDRVFGNEYKLDLPDAIGEFPYRSHMRGDFESKHYGTVTWDALQKFKKYLLENVLSYGGRKLPPGLWSTSLNNYIDNNIDVLRQEGRRWEYQNSWFGSPSNHFLFSDIDGDFSYSWQNDVDSPSIPVNLFRRQRPRESAGGFEYVARFKFNFSNRYTFYRLGEKDEFSLYMPEYENFGTGNDNYVTRGDPPASVYFNTTYNFNLNYGGMINDMIQHLEELRSLKYDYSNLDEALTKNWLYLKVSTPNIEPLGTNEVVSSYPYYNEVYIDHKLADVYLLFVLDLNPPPPESGDYSDPDFLVRDKWKTRHPGVGFNVNQFTEVDNKSKQDLIDINNPFGKGQKTRPFTFEYQFVDRLLIHTDPPVHSGSDPRIISGVEYVFSSVGGQPNYERETKLSFIPMRLRLQCVKPVRGETVFIMDSTAYETESKIDATRDKVLPVVLDKRITIFDGNFGAQPINQPVIDYNVNITKEFPP